MLLQRPGLKRVVISKCPQISLESSGGHHLKVGAVWLARLHRLRCLCVWAGLGWQQSHTARCWCAAPHTLALKPATTLCIARDAN